MILHAKRRKPLGYSDNSYKEEDVTVVGFCYGTFGMGQPEALAIYARLDGQLAHCPAKEIFLKSMD